MAQHRCCDCSLRRGYAGVLRQDVRYDRSAAFNHLDEGLDRAWISGAVARRQTAAHNLGGWFMLVTC